MWLCMRWHGAWLYGVHRTHRDSSSFMWHQPCQCCKYTTLVDIFKNYKKVFTNVESHASTVSAWEWRTALYKMINNNTAHNASSVRGMIIIFSGLDSNNAEKLLDSLTSLSCTKAYTVKPSLTELSKLTPHPPSKKRKLLTAYLDPMPQCVWMTHSPIFPTTRKDWNDFLNSAETTFQDLLFSTFLQTLPELDMSLTGHSLW